MVVKQNRSEANVWKIEDEKGIKSAYVIKTKQKKKKDKKVVSI